MCICHLITLVAPGTQIRQSGDQLICRDMQVFVLGKSVQMHTVKKKQLPEMPIKDHATYSQDKTCLLCNYHLLAI